MGRDAAEAAIEILQADATFVAMVTGGASNILDSGLLRMDTLADAEETRRDEVGTGILGVSVQDAGESVTQGDIYQQTVIVRLVDRLQGYGAVRTARLALYDALQHKSAGLDNGQGAVMEYRYSNRSGHRVDRTYNVHFEAVTFIATVQKLEV